jgi:hypothetical protein
MLRVAVLRQDSAGWLLGPSAGLFLPSLAFFIAVIVKQHGIRWGVHPGFWGRHKPLPSRGKLRSKVLLQLAPVKQEGGETGRGIKKHNTPCPTSVGPKLAFRLASCLTGR